MGSFAYAGMATARGFATLAVTLAGLLLVTFVVGRVMPIDPVVAAVGDKASPETYAKAREALGLDQSVWVQFGRYIKGVAQGDLGQSSLSGRPVSEDIAGVFPATVELSTLGILIGILAGVPLGVYAAHRRNRWPDQIIRSVSLLGYSTPVFWLGLIGLLIFYAQLGWSGGPGRIDTAYRYSIDEWSTSCWSIPCDRGRGMRFAAPCPTSLCRPCSSAISLLPTLRA